MNQLTAEQVKQLLQPIHPARVMQAQGHSHVSQQDVTAHLSRVFGFGNFDTEIVDLKLIFETERANPTTGESTGRWDVCYMCRFRLTVKNPDGSILSTYEDASMGDAQNQNRQDGHDLAMKSAISTAKKRCAINLGDQFGLSLYNKGQQTALVKGTLIYPEGYDKTEQVKRDVQADVDQQVSLGTDEVDKSTPEPTLEQAEALLKSIGATPVEEPEVGINVTPSNTEVAIARARAAQAKREEAKA